MNRLMMVDMQQIQPIAGKTNPLTDNLHVQQFQDTNTSCTVTPCVKCLRQISWNNFTVPFSQSKIEEVKP